MAAPRSGPVTSAWAAPRKLEGRTSASSWADPVRPNLGGPRFTSSRPSRARADHGGPPEPRARQLTSSRCLELGSARGSRHQPANHPSWALPAARGRCLELGWLAGSARGSRHCLKHQPADRPASSWAAH
ncbi:hypothetical protein Salat_2108800 [Sesamum alatum]|uniref:Uncharacterized protein n=1 Tax=Sesamum alatum TaxID=300844 RepID=A0AAE1Y146_9LAMI|nr:hypothetical protein Salat_2108800 [Sesamum alatum]